MVQHLTRVLSADDADDGGFFVRYLERPEPLDCERGRPIERLNEPLEGVWAAHFHTGELVGRVAVAPPPLWRVYGRYCAVGTTAEHAICLAALRGWMRVFSEKRLRHLCKPVAREPWD